ncbi:hypothetical protein CLAFUW4_03164 [Fulvia fulva]|uniref:Uncharacterized protein n=1 Tax=Passalora fulva TaxID=5499 RepID=A0A9Q8LBW4_PASFU|nr:uncharacterized protein CLAFUR5_03148 [Fulvia fulva]KAK4630868.1 hypothetical protein CLAFUR4_03153 [Fulvia fulva]KAK4632477.1 hypothetical protein CLAFUR0_03158 [Fulvia fulva]UJO14587.1 hypothetical protein CLAFUR5_03148 [Fulvia fulva]WPV11425.1 hypothetical protein CLAFUW4_03164 [Fulvia fulva]WPV26589.1 hypothetical protein CLAFUW7_03157 [Fulvia fulva]
MTSIQQQPHHMYADTAIRFRDPFLVSKKDITPSKSNFASYEQSRNGWPSPPRNPGAARPPTPPPEMTGVHPSARPSYYQQEHGHHYGDYPPAQQAHRAPVASYPSQDVVKSEVSRPAGDHTNGRASPVRHHEASNDYSASRRASHANAIALNFQIPRSVNDSGGSLSELAAQITCLFWFESSDILQQVEDSTSPIQPTKPLSTDAKPTTGFRKWVTTILSTTMVAQNVVLLALLFVYRLKKLNPSVKGKPGSEYRLLTVALMLGNKFLDDNTYTNKTWAEVSGINVEEVHIMEVEFLSNMKYCLFTSEQDWARWQSLLGRFAAFFDRASRPLPPAPVLPPASSLHLPLALPSPPVSNQASPPYPQDMPQNRHLYSTAAGQLGPTPAPSPLGNPHTSNGSLPPGSRKRSHESDVVEPPAKRMASGFADYTSPQRYSTLPPQHNQAQPVSRLTLPSLAIPTSQPTSNGYSHPPPSQGHQLPPLNIPARAMTMVFQNASAPGRAPTLPAPAGAATQSQSQSQYGSRHHSPYGGSGPTSPNSSMPQSATVLHPTTQISPSYFLQQRNSPYRPVQNFSTLLHPPPSSAIQGRPSNVELNRMQYQPLGKPTQHSGRLPYVAQNLWLDGAQPQEMTPIHQWPGFQQIPFRQGPQPQQQA